MFNWLTKQKMKNNSDYFQKILNNYLLYRKHTEELSQMVKDLLRKLDSINICTDGSIKIYDIEPIFTVNEELNIELLNRYKKISIFEYTSDIKQRLFVMHKMEKEND